MNKAQFYSRPGNPCFTFSNGITISIAYRNGNYCANYNENTAEQFRTQGFITCEDAEIAIWSGKTYLRHITDDDVLGQQTPNQVAIWISEIARAANIDSLQMDVERISELVKAAE